MPRVRLTPPDVRAASVSTWDAFWRAVRLPIEGSLRVCVVGGCHASRICSDPARVAWETDRARLLDCDLLCQTKLLLATPRHEGHHPAAPATRASGNTRGIEASTLIPAGKRRK